MSDFITLADINIESLKPKRKFIDCEIHGEQVEALLNNKCKKCHDEALKSSDNSLRDKLIINAKLEAFIPEKYINNTLQDYSCDNEIQKQVLTQLNQYSFNQHIVMLGSTGVGKTRLASSLIDKALKNSISALYIKYYDIARIVVKQEHIYKKMLNVDFLVIDEFGVSDKDSFKEKVTLENVDKINYTPDYKTQQLYEIFDKRSDKINKFSMIISNHNTLEMRLKMGDAFLSRIKQNCLSFNCNWEDYRLKGNK